MKILNLRLPWLVFQVLGQPELCSDIVRPCPLPTPYGSDGEMAQRVKALTATVEILGLVASTHMVLHNYP